MAFLQMKSVIFPVHRTKKKRGAEKPKTLYSLEGLYDKTLESKNGGGSKLSRAENPNRNNAGDDLLEAARYDDVDDIASLASSGVSLDSKDSLGRTALHMAAANGHIDIVEYLINQGVDLNAANKEKNTALHWACLNGHIEVVKKLILSGASLGILNSHERTPMDESVTRGKWMLLMQLMQLWHNWNLLVLQFPSLGFL